MMKKIILMLMMVIILTSCNKQDTIIESETTAEHELKMTNVFNVESKTLLPYYNIYSLYNNDRIFIIGDRIYFTAPDYAVDYGSSKLFLHSYTIDGYDETITKIESINDGSNVQLMWYDSEMNQIIVEEYDYEYYVSKVSPSGDVIFTQLTDAVISIVVGEDDNIYLGTVNKITVLNKNGDKLCDFSLPYTLYNFISAHGKKPIVKMYDNNHYVIYSCINTDTKSLEPIEMELPLDMYYMYSFMTYGDETYDYYHYTSDGIFGYNIETKGTTKVLDWINSDLNFSDVRMMAIYSPEVMAMVTYDNTIYRSAFNVIEHIDDDKVPQKEWIVLGYVSNGYPNDYINNMVASFNKNNNVYRIIVETYPDIESFNSNIASGRYPDLLYINQNFPVRNYVKQGMLIDLYDYLKDDEELYNNLLPFVLEPSEIDGKLYQMTTSFRALSTFGKTKNLNGMTSWTYGEMLDYYNSLPQDIIMLERFTRGSHQDILLYNILDECVDFTSGTCNFTVQGFYDLIDLLKAMPQSYYDEDIDRYEHFTMNRNDESMLRTLYTHDLMAYTNDLALAFAGEEATMIGYPSLSGDVPQHYMMTSGFAIMDKSTIKDIAWDFILYSLSDFTFKINSKAINNGGITPTMSAIEADARDEYYGMYMYYLYSGVTVGSDGPITQNEKDKAGPGIDVYIDDEWIERYCDYFKSMNNFSYYDSAIDGIIKEELDIHFNSDKFAEETARSIQSRVSLYMSETFG